MNWKTPDWMESYCGGDYLICNKQTIETHMNTDSTVNVFNNAVLALMVVATKARVELLEKLHNENLLSEKRITK